MRLLVASMRLAPLTPRCPCSLPAVKLPVAVLPGVPAQHPLPSPAGDVGSRPAALHTTAGRAGLRDLVAPGGAVRSVLSRLGVLNVSRARLRTVGYRLYESAADRPSYDEFFQLCEMPDTFFSWYLVTELHVWMLCVRLSDDGAEGKFCRDQLITAMWEDMETRSKKLGAVASSVRNEQIQQTAQHFQAALLGYDEGLQDDRVLAGALWRRLFSRAGGDAARLETALAYVRRELARLDRLSRDSLLLHGQNVWGELHVT